MEPTKPLSASINFLFIESCNFLPLDKNTHHNVLHLFLVIIICMAISHKRQVTRIPPVCISKYKIPEGKGTLFWHTFFIITQPNVNIYQCLARWSHTQHYHHTRSTRGTHQTKSVGRVHGLNLGNMVGDYSKRWDHNRNNKSIVSTQICLNLFFS